MMYNIFDTSSLILIKKPVKVSNNLKQFKAVKRDNLK